MKCAVASPALGMGAGKVLTAFRDVFVSDNLEQAVFLPLGHLLSPSRVQWSSDGKNCLTQKQD